MSGVEPLGVQSTALAVLGAANWHRLPDAGLSGLNYDCTPLQVVLTAGSDRVGIRLLGDPCCDVPDPADRYDASLNAMLCVLESAGSKSLGALLRRTLELNLPRERALLSDYPDGVMWLGAGLDGPGLAMYVDCRRGGHTVALERLHTWLRAVCGDTSDVASLVSALRNNTLLMCLGIEGLSFANARAKVYWRLDRPAELKSLGIPGFADSAFTQFLSLLVGDRRIRLSGIVLNAGIHVNGGEWADVKLDVCGCRNCLNLTQEEAAAAISALTSHFGLLPLPVADILEYGEFAFCGLGIDVRGQRRLNVYIKPRIEPS